MATKTSASKNTSAPNRRLAFTLFGILLVGIVALVVVLITLFGGSSDAPQPQHSAPSNGTPTVTVTHTAWPTNSIPAKK